MALYVCIVLLAEFVAAGEDAGSAQRAISVIWGTTLGLALAHVFAFHLAARLLVGGTTVPQDTRAAIWSQLGAAAGIAALATLPLLLFSLETGLQVSAYLTAGVVGVTAYLAARNAGGKHARAITEGIVVVAVAAVVVGVKVALSH